MGGVLRVLYVQTNSRCQTTELVVSDKVSAIETSVPYNSTYWVVYSQIFHDDRYARSSSIFHLLVDF